MLAFVRLSRPLFLYGGFAGVALGAAVAARAGARIELATYLWAQAMVTASQLMVHYANDYFDRTGDLHAERTPWSGGSGVLVAGELSARAALTAALVCAAIGLAAAARFTVTGAPVVGALGIAILVLAWCYSAPPLRLAARGLGEADTALVVAVLVPAVGYAVFAGEVDDRLVQPLIAPVLAMFAMMLCVELPDAGTDFIHGKRTLVVRLGPARSWTVVLALAATAAAVALVRGARADGVLGAVVLLPAVAVAVALVRCARGDPRPATMAFLGVALYATTVTGLAIAYALAAAGR